MRHYSAQEVVRISRIHGRTFSHEGIFYMNWTMSGLSLRFKGSFLKARVRAIYDQLPPMEILPDPPKDWPHLGVVLDGELIRRVGCETEEEVYDLFVGEEGTYDLSLVKLSENARGKLGLMELMTDGEILPAVVPRKNLSIEFLGDSITCGFGNEAPGEEAPFRTSEENGFMSYGAVCGRILQAETSFLCVSGISLSEPEVSFFPHPMPTISGLYGYTDQLGEAALGIKEPAKWDFQEHPAHVVIVNLGTNDVNPIRFARSFERAMSEKDHFQREYISFIKRLRELRGKDTLIGCTLGSMDYYLFDDIKEAVSAYISESGDKRIFTYKFIGINLMTEGFGSGRHPSLLTHERMGRELARVIETELNTRR